MADDFMSNIIKNEDWARLAAFIDGEGSIWIAKHVTTRKCSYHLVVRITNTDPRLFVWIGHRFGGIGSFGIYKNNGFPSERMMQRWELCSSRAALILKGCLPYFVMKREQAELAIAFQEAKDAIKWRRLSPKVNAERDVMYEKLREMKTPPIGWDEIVRRGAIQ